MVQRTKIKRRTQDMELHTGDPRTNPDLIAATEHSPTIEEDVMRALLDSIVERLKLFTSQEDAVFMAHFVDGYSEEKTADRLQLTRRAVRTAKKRIRNKLVKYFQLVAERDGNGNISGGGRINDNMGL